MERGRGLFLSSAASCMRYMIAMAIVVLSVFAIYDSVAQPGMMRVQGVVLSEESKEPIVGAQITSGTYHIGYTDYDGRFSIVINRTAELTFIYGPCDDAVIKLTGEQELKPILMKEKNVQLGVVVVTTKAKSKKVKVEPTDIEVKGNYYFLPTKFTIPTNIFTDDHRFIVQPTIYNITKQIRYNLRPVVIDGKNYKRVSYRNLGFDKKNDKLSPYVVDFDVTRYNNIYIYRDSLYFDPKNKDDDIRADCYLMLAGYDDPVIPIDTITIAKGTQNVMRFFKYKLSPMTLGGSIVKNIKECDDPLADSCDVRFIPPPDLDLMSDAGEAKITFAVNETKINQKDRDNAESLKKINDILVAVQNDVDVTLKSISMVGYASPEGSYESNKRLADLRTRGLLNVVTSGMSRDLRSRVKLESKGVVQRWSMLVDLIAKDDPALSQKVAEICKSTGDDFIKTPAALRKLPEYFKIILPKYLPQLRRVEYRIDYSVFRKLTDQEIRDKYAQSLVTGDPLSRYEYYRIICMETDRAEREKIEDLASSVYKNFMWVLNRVAVRGILKNNVDIELLKPALKERKPAVPIVYNQALSALISQNLVMADSLMMTLPEETQKSMEYAQAVINALNGFYAEALPVISKDGGLNPILLLLGLKRNDAAYTMMKQLLFEDPANAMDPHMLYTMAQCANRLVEAGNVSLLGEAIGVMTNLVTLYPDVASIAAGDSDVMDLYRLVTQPDVQQGGSGIVEEEVKGWKKYLNKFLGYFDFLKKEDGEGKAKSKSKSKQKKGDKVAEDTKGEEGSVSSAKKKKYLKDIEQEEVLELDPKRADKVIKESKKAAKSSKAAKDKASDGKSEVKSEGGTK